MRASKLYPNELSDGDLFSYCCFELGAIEALLTVAADEIFTVKHIDL